MIHNLHITHVYKGVSRMIPGMTNDLVGKLASNLVVFLWQKNVFKNYCILRVINRAFLVETTGHIDRVDRRVGLSPSLPSFTNPLPPLSPFSLLGGSQKLPFSLPSIFFPFFSAIEAVGSSVDRNCPRTFNLIIISNNGLPMGSSDCYIA